MPCSLIQPFVAKIPHALLLFLVVYHADRWRHWVLGFSVVLCWV